jgi:hypothetical protein
MSNAIENKKTMKKQVRKYLVAKEILRNLLSKKYSEEVWKELDSCKEKVSNLEPIYIDFNKKIVSKVRKEGFEIKIKGKGNGKFLNEQSGMLLDFLIRNPKIRELDWLYFFLFLQKNKGAKK